MLGEGIIKVMRRVGVDTIQARLGFMRIMVRPTGNVSPMNWQRHNYDR